MTNGGAPVCPISRDQAVAGQPGLRLPPSPRALDLPSLIAAVNNLRTLLMMSVTVGPVVNNIYPPLPFGNSELKKNNSAGGGRIKRGWQEIKRLTDKLLVQHSEQQPTVTGEHAIVAVRSDQIVVVERFMMISFQSNPGFYYDEFEWVQKKQGATDPQV